MMVLNGKLERATEGCKARFVDKTETPGLYWLLGMIPALAQQQIWGRSIEALVTKNTHNSECVLMFLCEYLTVD